MPAEPNYLLRSPDSEVTPFHQLLERYTGLGREWVDLRPQMGLRVENAYFKKGMPRRGLEGYIGTEVAQYRSGTRGSLRLVSVESKVAQRPDDQPAVQELLPRSLARYRYHRYFYQIVFRSKGNARGAVLLGARSMPELERLGERLLADPDSVCGPRVPHCTVFPEACAVTLGMEVVVNGDPRYVLWGSAIANVAAKPRRLELLRKHDGRLTPVELNFTDPKALRLPLLPGDQINWE